MKKIAQWFVLSLTLIITLSACQYMAPSLNKENRTPGGKVDDQFIRNNILKKIKKNGLDDSSHINVAVFNSIVLLTGEADNEKTKQQLTDVAEDIYKVRKTYNEMHIAAPSSLVSRSSDSVITGTIKTNLFRHSDTRSSHVKVTTENGVVYLMGLVSENEATKIVRTASGVNGVQKIVKLFEITKQ